MTIFGIHLLDTAVNKKEREEGLDWSSALREGAGSRIGKDFVVPSIGGLAFSLVMTLIFMPSLYALIRNVKEKYF